MIDLDPQRRRLLGATVSSLGLLLATRADAAVLLKTPRQTAGPFYPLELPLDQDNDLVTVAGKSGIAKGEIVNVVGRVLDTSGRPIKGARIEIWQCDANGRYRHPRERGSAPIDPHFQGYGHFVTAENGAYRFRTIKPVPYPRRAPHIHFAISGPDIQPLTTQMYVAGAPENERDFLLNSIQDAQARQSLIVEFGNVSGSDEPVGEFTIVLAAG
jgi:protocatechuate 3,4-dioxygenase beta subunit